MRMPWSSSLETSVPHTGGLFEVTVENVATGTTVDIMSNGLWPDLTSMIISHVVADLLHSCAQVLIYCTLKLMKKEIVIIVGPTATGKSDFAVDYAIGHNGEVISADSRQVYKGLDIGTGKITVNEMHGITHHLLDVADPRKQFNVEKYRILAEKSIEDILSRGKLPIICGGTGFYIDAVINNVQYPNVPHDLILRKKLSDKDPGQLFERLNKLDGKYAIQLNNSEKNNKQRLIRSIEIATKLGKIPKLLKKVSPYNTKWIGLNYPDQKLRERIHNRLLNRMNIGMIEEVDNLHKRGLSWKRMEELGLEYRYISRYLRGLISKTEMLSQLEKEIWHYAKRQIVWFRGNEKIKWIINE